MDTTGTDTLSPEIRFGRQLRAWRRRAGLTQAQLGHRVGYHHTLISKLENGSREAPLGLVRRLDDLLGARGELTDLATSPITATGTSFRVDPTLFSAIPGAVGSDRQLLTNLHAWPSRLPDRGVTCPLHDTAGCDVPPPDVAFRGLLALRDGPPAGVDPDIVHGLAGLLACYTQTAVEDLSTTVLGPVEQALRLVVRWARDLNATGTAPGTQLGLAANYAQLAGRLRMQRGQNSIGMAWFGHGLRWAQVSGDLIAHATLLTDLCTLARLDGDPHTALGYAQALDAVDRRRGWVVTLAHLYQARGYASIGDATQTQRHIVAARRLLSRLDERDRLEAPWLSGDAAQVRVESAVGGALRDLAGLRRDRVAARRGIYATRLSLACLPSRMHPAYLLLTLRLADSHACAGEPDAAVATARPVLKAALSARRATIRHELYGLRNRLTHHWADAPEVRDFLTLASPSARFTVNSWSSGRV
jgi:transcriptional regulator with XRE-family HTH domain